VKKIKATIINYNLCNLFSVKNALEKEGFQAIISNSKKEILDANIIILPGIGAFNEAMHRLKKLDLDNFLTDLILNGKNFLGICLGMQLLFDKSYEFGEHKGLGVLKGNVYSFKDNKKNNELRVPFIGWNKIYPKKKKLWKNTPLNGINPNSFMYFVHSYFVKPKNKNIILSLTNYSNFEYCSSIMMNNIFAFQFHPERSGVNGLNIYKNIKKSISLNKYIL